MCKQLQSQHQALSALIREIKPFHLGGNSVMPFNLKSWKPSKYQISKIYCHYLENFEE